MRESVLKDYVASIICIMRDNFDDIQVFNVVVPLGRQALLSALAILQRLTGEHDCQRHGQEKHNERDQEDIHSVALLDGCATRGNVGTDQRLYVALHIRLCVKVRKNIGIGFQVELHAQLARIRLVITRLRNRALSWHGFRLLYSFYAHYNKVCTYGQPLK